MNDIAPVVTRKLDNRPYPKDWERRARVVSALSERQLSLKSLAEKLEVTPGYLSSIIWGRRRLASAEHAIATALGYSWESLFASDANKANGSGSANSTSRCQELSDALEKASWEALAVCRDGLQLNQLSNKQRKIVAHRRKVENAAWLPIIVAHDEHIRAEALQEAAKKASGAKLAVFKGDSVRVQDYKNAANAGIDRAKAAILAADPKKREIDCGTCQWGGYDLCAMPFRMACACDPSNDNFSSWEPRATILAPSDATAKESATWMP